MADKVDETERAYTTLKNELVTKSSSPTDSERWSSRLLNRC